MELFRVTKKRYQNDLSGYGSYLSGGRWNSLGRSAFYTASSRSLAILEALVHITTSSPNQEDFVIMVIYVPDDFSFQVVQKEDLSQSWKEEKEETVAIGNKWIEANKDLVLRAPSIIVKNEFNYIFNTQHLDYQQVKLIDLEPFEFDIRLLK